MNLIMFFLATIGLTNILVHGRVLDVIKLGKKSVREWMTTPEFFKELLGCYECTGFWSGLIIGLIMFHFSWWVILCGFAGSVVSQTFTDIMYIMRSKIEFEIDDDEQ